MRQVLQAKILGLGTLQMAPEAGKQNTIPKDSSQQLICLKKVGAGEGIRTLDPDLGKVVLYP